MNILYAGLIFLTVFSLKGYEADFIVHAPTENQPAGKYTISALGDLHSNQLTDLQKRQEKSGFFISVMRNVLKRVGGLYEASALNKERVARALKNAGYEHDVMVLESKNIDCAYTAAANSVFRIIILNSYYFNKNKFDEFSLYHEIGHLYHNHNLKLLFDGLVSVLGSSLSVMSSDSLGIKSNMLFSLNLGVLFIAALMPISRAHEREADLYACDQIIKQGRVDLVYEDMQLIRSSQEHHEMSMVPALFSESHPSFPEAQKYFTQCIKDHGLWGSYLETCSMCTRADETVLQCSCLNNIDIKKNSTLAIPCSGEIVNGNGVMACQPHHV